MGGAGDLPSCPPLGPWGAARLLGPLRLLLAAGQGAWSTSLVVSPSLTGAWTDASGQSFRQQGSWRQPGLSIQPHPRHPEVCESISRFSQGAAPQGLGMWPLKGAWAMTFRAVPPAPRPSSPRLR